MRYVRMALLLVLMLVSSACDTGSSTPTTTPLALTLEQEGQQISAVFSLPFQVALPAYLPDGMKLAGVSVSWPSSIVKDAEGNVMEWGNAESRRRLTRAELRFSNEEKTDGLLLYESIALSSTGSSGAVKIMIGDVEGEILEQEDPWLISLAWPGNGIGYSITAIMRGSLTKEEVIRIAESLPTRHQ